MIDLEERIRRAAELLDDESVRARPLPETRRTVEHVGRRGVSVVQVAAVCILVVGLAGMFWAATRSPASAPATSDSPAVDGGPASTGVSATAPMTTVATASSIPTGGVVATAPATTAPSSVEQWVPPAVSLPVMADVSSVVPATVLATGPSDWYRLQPDLDVAWYSDGGDKSMLCFRTPAGQECQLDEFAPTSIGGGPIGVRSLNDQLLIVTLDPEQAVVVAFDNGQTITAQVERDDQIGWGVARMDTATGATPLDLAMVFEMDSAGTSVPVTTAPPIETAPPTTG